MIVDINWKYEKLGSVCKTGAGGTPLKSKKEYYENAVIPWLLSGEVNNRNITESKNFISKLGLENSSARIFPKDSVLIAMYGATAGQVGILRFEAASNQAVCAIYPNDNFLPEFLYYFFLNEKDKLIAKAVGNAQPNISQIKIKDTEIPIIPLQEQRTIVAKLDQAFTAIDQAKANIEKNIANAKELFQSKLNQIFSQNIEGYIVEKLDSVLIKTKNINPNDFPGKSFKYVDVSAVDRNELKITDYIEINSENAPSRARKLILENDVIFATVRPTLRRVAIIEKDFDSQICSTGYVVLRNNKDKIHAKLIFYFLLTSEFLENIEKLQKGASYPAVTDSEVKNQLISYPNSLENQLNLVKHLDILQKQTNLLISKYEQKLTNLEELKKSILEKAFKGELT